MPERMTEERRNQIEWLIEVIQQESGKRQLAEQALLDCWNEMTALRQEVRGLRWLVDKNCPPGRCLPGRDCEECIDTWLAKGSPGMGELTGKEVNHEPTK